MHEPVPSPCIDVCRMNASTGWCEGCLRSLDEIAAWSTLTDDGKRAVLAHLPERRARAFAQTQLMDIDAHLPPST